MRKIVKTIVVSTAAVTLAGAAAGVAYASWSAGGASSAESQSAKGAARAKAPLTLTTSSPAGLYPTQSNAGNVEIAVDNSNPYDVLMNSATAAQPGAAVIDVESNCQAELGHFTFGPVTWSANRAVRNGGADATGTIAITAVSNDLPDACSEGDIAFQVRVNAVSAPGQTT